MSGPGSRSDTDRSRIGDIALSCTALLVDELVRAGMRHACISPGSRSTPIALALARHPAVTVHVHLDERASAFFALGIAKGSGRAVAVACTSGTAAAELLPAVVEASQSRVPLILLTADRPPNVRGTGANQTIDQVELYGRYVRRFEEAPLPHVDDASSTWLELGSRVVRAALAEPPGPVHVNLPFDEPLTPTGAGAPLDPAVGRPGEPAPVQAIRDESDDATGAAERFLQIALGDGPPSKGLIVAGSLPGVAPDIFELADRLGWPLVAEPISGMRRPGSSLASGQSLIGARTFLEQDPPRVLLQIGAAPTTRATQQLVAGADELVVVDRHHLEPDPLRRADLRIRLDPNELARSAIRGSRTAATNDRTDGRWLARWRRADAVARAAIDELLDAWDEPFEGRVARDLAASIPDGGTLVVGNSMPIRDLDSFMWPRARLRVLANRGASGIDGFVSTVLGVAATEPERPTYALMGDLTLLHDAGSLVWSGGRAEDGAVIVVQNNGGGTIFSFLPQMQLPELDELFTTPHRVDLEGLAGAARVGYRRVERAGELVPAIREAERAGGVHLLDVTVDAELNRARHGQVQAAVDDALRVLDR